MNKNIFLRSNRLYYEPLEEKHLSEQYVSWLNSSKITQYNSHGVFPNTYEKTKSYVQSLQSDKSSIILAMIDELTNIHVGNIAIQSIDLINSNCEISIMIGNKNFWSKGYGYEAFYTVMKHCFNKLNLHKISLGTTIDNLGMQRIAQKLNMTLEGTRREEMQRDGKYFDVVLYGIVKNEFVVNKPKIVASIEARMTSSRLPGKVLKEINNIPALELMVNRVKISKSLNDIIIATTINKEDDAIVNWCIENNINYFRGSENNVYERVLNTHISFNNDVVVELTGDCPLLDPRLIDEAIKIYLKNDYDYVSNCIEETYPLGMAVEVFSLDALKTIQDDRELSYVDKEHVSPYFYVSKQYKIFNIQAPKEHHFPTLSVTLDTKEDYEMIKNVDAMFNDKNYTLSDIIDVVNENKQWLEINQDIHRKGLD